MAPVLNVDDDCLLPAVLRLFSLGDIGDLWYTDFNVVLSLEPDSDTSGQRFRGSLVVCNQGVSGR